MRTLPLLAAGLTATLTLIPMTGCATSRPAPQFPLSISSLQFPGEVHLKNIRQLTAGGTNAEAYWSYDSQWLTLQAKGAGLQGIPAPGPDCDQIYRVRADGTDAQLVSTGRGRTTCSFYLPGDERILYSSTHSSDAACPAEPDRSKGYVWPIYPSYQLYSVNPQKPESIQAMEPTAPSAYNAEAVTCRDGSVIFTSDRDGDLELYTAKIDRQGLLSQITRITHTPGYDGGAFFSQDCKKIVWRASRPQKGARGKKDFEDYQSLLKQHLVRPSQLEIYTADADGKNARQVTRLNAASFAPYFTPKADRILFSSNFEDPQGRTFAIYSIRIDGTGLKRITFSGVFDGFPMFSPDGKKLAFSSNRNGSKPRETNVFVADWVENPESEKRASLDDSSPTDRYHATVMALSAPEFAGRGIGTSQMAQAEDFTVSLFIRAGLEPFFETFRETFRSPLQKTSTAGSGFKHPVQIRVLEGPSTAAPIPGNNILGTYGSGCHKGVPAVLIGAHLDHLGLGAPGSLEATKKGIHHGADDNASGVAGVLEAARAIQSDKAAAGRCFIFAAFTGEESGVAGSARVAELLQSSKITLKAMLNLDMVGRLRNNQLIIFGSESATEWKPWIEAECTRLGLTCPGGGDGYGPSDQMPFYMKGAPVLHFFTGPHADYHRVSDTSEKINATGGVQVAEAVSALALRASAHPRRLKYQKSQGTPSMMLVRADGTTATAGQQARQGMGGAYLGTIPDYAQMTSPSGPGGDASQGGVLLSGARTGSPAEKAGVQAGDILVSVLKVESKESIRTRTLAEFMQVLRTLKAGDVIVLGVRRGDKVLELSATVGSRSAPEGAASTQQ
jgi:hypothetical protein